MKRLSAYEENKKILTWASMSDAEFFFRYFTESVVGEVAEFLRLFPEFMES